MNFETLRARADRLDRLRSFFRQRGFLEVETPLLSREVIPEQHIGLFGVEAGGWLQASPEMHHKRLLCAGSGPIFEVARSCRAGERGARHSSEFTLVEWYRPGNGMAKGMDLLDELIRDLLSYPEGKRTSYREAFQRKLGIDPHLASTAELQAATVQAGVDAAGLSLSDHRDEWLNLLLSTVIEPELGRDLPEVIYHYPATQSALATTVEDDLGVVVAERFELYIDGLELANGYHELTDAVELRRRLVQANEQRVATGQPELPLPEQLLADMESPGLPPCAGVALGFDRLVMLATGAREIGEVRAFADDG